MRKYRVAAILYAALCCLLLWGTAQPVRGQEADEGQRFLQWYEQHKETGGTFTMQRDMVIDRGVEVENTAGEFTIAAGSHTICVRGQGEVNFGGEGETIIHITGGGSGNGILQVLEEGRLSGEGVSIDLQAREGTAVSMAGNSLLSVGSLSVTGTGTMEGAVTLAGSSDLFTYKDLYIDMKSGTAIRARGAGSVSVGRNWTVKTRGGNAVALLDEAEMEYANWYSATRESLLQTENASAVYVGADASFFWSSPSADHVNRIISSGEGCAGIELEQAESELENFTVSVTGKNSVGIKSRGRLSLNSMDVTAKGTGARSVSPEAQVAASFGCVFVPALFQEGSEAKTYAITKARDSRTLDAVAKAGMHIADVKLPQKVPITAENGGDTVEDTCRVIWSEDSLQRGIKTGRDFLLEGEFDFNREQEERYRNPYGIKPQVTVKFRTELLMKKMTVGFRENGGRYDMAMVGIVKPWNASKVIAETSGDRTVWRQRDITETIGDGAWDILEFAVKAGDVPAVTYIRVWMEDRIYTGYTDTWKLDFRTGKGSLVGKSEGGGQEIADLGPGDGGGDRGGGGNMGAERHPNTPKEQAGNLEGAVDENLEETTEAGAGENSDSYPQMDSDKEGRDKATETAGTGGVSENHGSEGTEEESDPAGAGSTEGKITATGVGMPEDADGGKDAAGTGKTGDGMEENVPAKEKGLLCIAGIGAAAVLLPVLSRRRRR